MSWEPAEAVAVRELLAALDGLDCGGSDLAALGRLSDARRAVEAVLPPVVHIRHRDGTGATECTVEPGSTAGSWRIVAPGLLPGDALVVDRAGAYTVEWLE